MTEVTLSWSTVHATRRFYLIYGVGDSDFAGYGSFQNGQFSTFSRLFNCFRSVSSKLRSWGGNSSHENRKWARYGHFSETIRSVPNQPERVQEGFFRLISLSLDQTKGYWSKKPNSDSYGPRSEKTIRAVWADDTVRAESARKGLGRGSLTNII